MPQLWNPTSVLQLSSDNRCVGYAPSKGRKCMSVVNAADRRTFAVLLDDLAEEHPDAEELKQKLKRLAQHGLCKGNHRTTQGVEDMLRKWSDRIRAAYPEEEQEEEVEELVVLIRRAAGRRSGASADVHEVQTLQDTIAALQERIRAAQRQLDIPQRQSSPAVSRVSTSNISPLHLSRSSTLQSHTRRSAVPPTPAPSTRAPAATPSTPRLPPPPSPPARTPPSTPPARTQAPRTPSPPPTPSSHTHVRRLPLDTSCPICYEPFTPTDAVTWCRSSCGRTVHASCFDAWRAAPANRGARAKCMVCRGAWCECAGCDVVHVQRRGVRGEMCSICLEGLEGGGELEWCKGGCGKSVHGECFAGWRAACGERGRAVRCMECRAEWGGGCEC